MSLFKRIFKPSSENTPPDAGNHQKSQTALILPFNHLPTLDASQIAHTITAIEPTNINPIIRSDTASSETLSTYVEFDGHKLRLIGLPMPVPGSILERTVQVSNWQQEQKEVLRQHRTHVLCFYDGDHPNPTEQLIALYKVAYSFYDQGLLGILDEDAWNCIPRDFIKEQLDPDMLRACREAVPIGIWTGFVKLFKSDQSVWFCSKGHHRFGVNDFAYLGQLNESDRAFNLFATLFNYVHRYGAKLKIGDIAQIGAGIHLKFNGVTEYHEYLESPSGTLVVELI